MTVYNIADIDPNFKIETNIKKEGIRFINILNEPFKLYGISYENGKYRRMPEAVAQSVSRGVYSLHTSPAGGRLRFRTDSPYVAIHTKQTRVAKIPQYPLAGTGGFALYVREDGKERYRNSFLPPVDIVDGFESVINLGETKMRDITVCFPLHSDVLEVYVGIDKSSLLEAPTPYRVEKPVVYYGSSITQGGCATRPGNTYEDHITRRLDCDHINLGFSGNCMAEDEMAEYICGLDMSVFVYDYDYNSPDAEHLAATHEKLFRTVRRAHPDLPIVIMTAPKFFADDEIRERRGIIKQTYLNALERGDENVYYIDGTTLFAICEDNGTVDGIHPNDLGFYSMAQPLGDLLERLI